MVTTRSGKKSKEINIITHHGKITKRERVKKELLPKESSLDDLIDDEEEESESEEDEDSDFEEDDFLEEEFETPKEIRQKRNLEKRFDRLVQRIKKNEPTLEKIINLKIRLKRKLYLLQQYYIYKSSFPYTEERYFLKKQLLEKIKYYEKEYIDYIDNKETFDRLEKSEKSEGDIIHLKSKLLGTKTNDNNLKILFQKFSVLESRGSHDEEFFKLFNWLKLSLNLPFEKICKLPNQNEISTFMQHIRIEMDKELYGMIEVKEKILLYIHNRIVNPYTQNFPLALLGKPGIGKTSIALLISKVLSLPFQQISMGGINNSEFLLGFDSCYVGSKPGQIAQALIQMQAKNGILFFDEFCKISENKDIVSAMLHITDNSQNHNFRDNFFGNLQIDLSTCLFIMSMNEKPLNKALDDRLNYIHIPEYSEKDKIQIVKNYLLPKCLKNLNISPSFIVFQQEAIVYFIRKVSPDVSGIRLLKQNLTDMLSKILFLINNPELKTSFSLPVHVKLEYPFIIDTNVIDKLIVTRNEINQSITQMYI